MNDKLSFHPKYFVDVPFKQDGLPCFRYDLNFQVYLLHPNPLRHSRAFLDIRMTETARPSPQHLRSLLKGHIDLISNRDKAFRQMNIVLTQQVHRNKDVIHIPEHKSALLSIAILLLDECCRMVSPVTTRVKMMRSVVPIVEGEAITLDFVSILRI